MSKANASDPEDELARAEAEIYGRFSPKQTYPAPTASGTSAPGPGPEPSPPAPAEGPRPRASEEDQSERESEGDACETACTALASMQRAVDRICAIAGGTAERCTRARERLSRARETVESQCEECES